MPSANSALSRPAHKSCSQISARRVAAASSVITARSECSVRAAPPDQFSRRHRRAAIIRDPIGEAETGLARQFGFLRPRQPRHRAVVRQHQIVFNDLLDRRAAALNKAQRAIRRGGVERIGHRQRLDHGARRHRPVDHIAVAALAQCRCIDAVNAGVGEQRADQRIQRRAAEPAGEPVPGLPVRPVAPDVGGGRKHRIGPRIPGPQMQPRRRRPCARHTPARPGYARRPRRRPDRTQRGTASSMRR